MRPRFSALLIALGGLWLAIAAPQPALAQSTHPDGTWIIADGSIDPATVESARALMQSLGVSDVSAADRIVFGDANVVVELGERSLTYEVLGEQTAWGFDLKVTSFATGQLPVTFFRVLTVSNNVATLETYYGEQLMATYTIAKVR